MNCYIGKAIFKNHPEPVMQFVLPKRFIHKVILACHDDNRHLEMEQTLRLLQEKVFWPKMAEDVCTHICTCERCLRFKQPQERVGMAVNSGFLSNGIDSSRFPYIRRKSRRC